MIIRSKTAADINTQWIITNNDENTANSVRGGIDRDRENFPW